MNIKIFYHISTLPGYEFVVDRQLIRIKQSGLYDVCNAIVVGLSTDNKDFQTIYSLFNKHLMADKLLFIEHCGKISDQDFHTLKCLHNFTLTDNDETRILYLYNMTSIRGNSKPILDWMELLEYFAIDLWRYGVNKLNDYDLYGANYKQKTDTLGQHFCGNIWWSKSSYIKCLDSSLINLQNKQSFELWICSKEGHGVVSPHVSSIDHYGVEYPFYMYRMSKKITTLISYSTNDKKFLKECINHSIPFSEEVIVSFCDHFFDGSPCLSEDLDESVDIILECGAIPVMFKYNNVENPQKGSELESRWWNNYQRECAFNLIKKDSDWLLWIDVDEIVDTQKFIDWINSYDFGICNSYSLSNYWYWRETNVVAENIESNTIFCRRDGVSINDFYKNPAVERENFLHGMQEHCKKGVNGEIFVHHYSWVRSKEEMIKKTSTWSHNKDNLLLFKSRANLNLPDASWKDIVEHEFTHNIVDRDFLHGYKLGVTERYITIQ